ncbi:hypothetical protein ES332_D01G122400v1 [Gossypium tomentosum]|uniref:Uncharacterized protein n=1 Tax=Gossypium tomentosum TaxID=34277 RepID=A0A5D2M860_GOSTO|nr:hypothetical protein ES332_D01G122400v1 [Gossypium tomentosum]
MVEEARQWVGYGAVTVAAMGKRAMVGCRFWRWWKREGGGAAVVTVAVRHSVGGGPPTYAGRQKSRRVGAQVAPGG